MHNHCVCVHSEYCVYMSCVVCRVCTHGCRQSKHARALRNPIIFGGPPHTADKGITPNVALNWHTRLKIIRRELCNWKIPAAYVRCLFRGIEMEKKNQISTHPPPSACHVAGGRGKEQNYTLMYVYVYTDGGRRGWIWIYHWITFCFRFIFLFGPWEINFMNATCVTLMYTRSRTETSITHIALSCRTILFV